MRLALEQASQGFPAPNPRVGCVVVKDDRVIGKGGHVAAGHDHAEVVALKMAGSRAKGSTAYVTLEPCNHHGRTPPCSEALIAAGVARVVIGNSDPNPKATGGIARLREAGIEVMTDVLASECEAMNRIFLHAMRRKRPYVVLKIAMSLDGRIAESEGKRTQLTGSEARAWTHRLRAELGSILIGANTAIVDDPLLTVRDVEATNQPTRYVLDPRRRVPAHCQLWHQPGRAVRLPVDEANDNLPSTHRMSTADEIARELFQMGEIGVLVEGGPTTWHSFLEQGKFEELHVVIAPKILGSGPRAFRLLSALPLRQSNVSKLGADVALTFVPG